MKSNAPGQLFGYSLQFPRALLRLLEADIGASVGIEVCGDVSVYFPEGGILTEEDKSSLTSNALTDLSSNLWKTLYNWIAAINIGELNADKSRFVLYTNHRVTEGALVITLHNTVDETVDDAIQHATVALKDVKEGHELFKYKTYVIEENLNCFRKILPRFELVTDHRADDVYQDIRLELKKMAIVDKEIEWVLETLTGWLQKTIMQKIASQNSPIVSKDSLLCELRPLLGQIRRRELIDFAVSKIPSREELSIQVTMRPFYVKQLEYIGLSDDEIIEGVIDYFRAHSNRLDWIAQEIVNEADMDDFEGKLCSFHSNKQKLIELTQTLLPEETRGKLLLNECQTRHEMIAGKEPPNRTIQGSYHVLADEKCLGWHPRWKDLLTALNT